MNIPSIRKFIMETPAYPLMDTREEDGFLYVELFHKLPSGKLSPYTFAVPKARLENDTEVREVLGAHLRVAARDIDAWIASGAQEDMPTWKA